MIEGKPVVTALDVEDLEPGQKHLLYFQGCRRPRASTLRLDDGRQGRAARTARRLISGVHGDEMSSIRTVQRVMEQLDPAAMAGTVLAVFDVSRPPPARHAAAVAQHGRGIGLRSISTANGPATRTAALPRPDTRPWSSVSSSRPTPTTP